jgi:hypothetical protein
MRDASGERHQISLWFCSFPYGTEIAKWGSTFWEEQ